jgi:hypothetical protein
LYCCNDSCNIKLKTINDFRWVGMEAGMLRADPPLKNPLW